MAFGGLQLVEHGPSLPAQFMAALEEGTLVFFCGAGTSMPTFPDFRGLVRQVWEKLGIPAPATSDDGLERTLYRLERDSTPGTMREAIAAILKPADTVDTSLHEALLRLSTVGDGPPRLVTTNFDTLFDLAAKRLNIAAHHHAAPRLVRPDIARWRSIAYLHGWLGERSSRDELVVTSADYGRAYLTDGYATRFLVDLFRDFTVVFVGYSATDPPMRYMLDARATESGSGKPVYAFAGHLEGKRENVRADWEDRGVEPLPYLITGTETKQDHGTLRATLVELAAQREQGLQGRIKVVRDSAKHQDPQPESIAVGQTLHFISEPACAEAFATAEPLHGVNWLPLLASAGLLDGIADRRLQTEFNPRRMHFAHWLMRHLPNEDVLDWIITQGGIVGHELAQQLERRLASDPPPPDLERRAFRLLLEARRSAAPASSAARAFTQAAMPVADAVEEMLASLEPSVSLASAARWRDVHDKFPGLAEEPVLLLLLDVKIRPRPSFSKHRINGYEAIPGWQAALAAAAHRLCDRLETADALHVLADNANAFGHGKTADAGKTEEHRGPWRLAVGLLRDAALHANATMAESLVLRWQEHTAVVFRKLAAFVLAKRDDLPSARMFDFLLERRVLCDGVLEAEMQPLLKAAGRRADPRQLRQVAAAIARHPPTTSPRGQPMVLRRLTWLAESATLPVVVEKRRARLAARYPDVDPSPDHIEAPVEMTERLYGDGDDPPGIFHDKAPAEIAALLREDPKRAGALRKFVPDNPQIALALARHMAKTGEWPPEAWHAMLVGLVDAKTDDAASVRADMLALLAQAPDALLAQESWAVGWFVNCAWPETDTPPDPSAVEFWQRSLAASEPAARTALQRVPDPPFASRASSSPERTVADRIVDIAIDTGAGLLVEAVLLRLWRGKMRVGQTLRAPERALLTAICDGTASTDRLGRVVLARRLNTLFALDPAWTSQHLIARFNPSDPHHAELWSAFLYGPSVSPDLFVALRPAYLALPQGPQDLTVHRLRTNFYELAVLAALRMPGTLPDDLARSFLLQAGRDGLQHVARAVDRAARGTGSGGAALWEQRILPWLNSVWPKAKKIQSEKATERLACAALEAGEAMPAAVAFVQGLGERLHRPRALLARLDDDDSAAILQAQPDSVLALLGLIHDVTHEEARPLLDVLAALARNDPGISGDARWKRLDELARRRQAGS